MRITDQNLNPNYVPYLQDADNVESGGNGDGEINEQELQKALQLILDGKKISELSAQEQNLLRTYADNHANDDPIDTPEEISAAIEAIKKALTDQEKSLEDFFYTDRGLNIAVPANVPDSPPASAEKEKKEPTIDIETGYEGRFGDDINQHGIKTDVTIKGENSELNASTFLSFNDLNKPEFTLAINAFLKNWYLGGGDLTTPLGFLQQYNPNTIFPGINASTPSFANGIISAGAFAYAYAPGATQSMYNLVEALVNNDVPVTVIGGNLTIDIPNTGVRIIPYGGYISGQVPGDIEAPDQAAMDQYYDNLTTWITNGMQGEEPQMPGGAIPMVKEGGGIYGLSAGWQHTFHPGGNPLNLDINAAIEGWTTRYQSGVREGQPYEQKLGFGISAAAKYIVGQWSFSAYVGIGDSITWLQSPGNPNEFDQTALHAFQTNTGLEVRWDSKKEIYFFVRGNFYTETKDISEINYNMDNVPDSPKRVTTGSDTNIRGDIFIGVGGHPDRWEWPKKARRAINKFFTWLGEKLGIGKSKPFQSQ
ncbi:MAG: hypothetical protein LBJ25_03235 [Candidatus Margulisbacteria bacterium]|jgi:hypothetical protein|nr:hypothetical protein [Candidatus Margulisiibacteriota bacterium]